MIPRQITLFFLLALTPLPAFADLERITDRGMFLSAVEGRELSRFAVNLTVMGDGSISGQAFGRTVTGTWNWEDGFFCRTLNAGDRDFGLNCQAVSIDGNEVRFQSDQGTGDFADFTIR